MDDDLDVGGGGHILASVSRLRTARQAAVSVVNGGSTVPKTMWGFKYTRYPRPGEETFVIYDEVRFTALILIIFASLCALGFLIADLGLGHISIHQIYTNDGHGVAVIVGGIFAFLASVLSAIQVRSHWANWTHPPSQKLVVRILYMVPIYAISAWGSLTFLDFSAYIDFIRGVYEAFVIYTFMILLTKYLGGHNGVVEWMKYKGPQAWPSPLCCMKKVKPDSEYLYYLKYGALQYTILTPICSLAALVLQTFGAYSDGVIAYDNGYPYIAFIMNASQMISLYCLVWLYVCMKNELAPFGPLYKFGVVKAVVFATFWQGVGLAIMAHLGWITKTDNFELGEVQVGMQDFLVCIEMFLAACMHKYTFGSETYANGSLRLIMEQRALYLAEQSYKRAQDAQKEAQKLADALAEAADPSLKGTLSKDVPDETPEEAAIRKAHMAALISRAMDEDTEGDVLFNEDEVDWSTKRLPISGHTRQTAPNTTAYDYLYAYELEQQHAEGVAEGTVVNGVKNSVQMIPMTDIDFGNSTEEYVQPQQQQQQQTEAAVAHSSSSKKASKAASAAASKKTSAHASAATSKATSKRASAHPSDIDAMNALVGLGAVGANGNGEHANASASVPVKSKPKSTPAVAAASFNEMDDVFSTSGLEEQKESKPKRKPNKPQSQPPHLPPQQSPSQLQSQQSPPPSNFTQQPPASIRQPQPQQPRQQQAKKPQNGRAQPPQQQQSPPMDYGDEPNPFDV